MNEHQDRWHSWKASAQESLSKQVGTGGVGQKLWSDDQHKSASDEHLLNLSN